MPPSWGAGALLHPGRKVAIQEPIRPHETVDLDGAGVRLKAWRFRTEVPKRGTVICLHGVADNRGSCAWIADHFVPRGFDVIAYDSRAHGQSTGDACTYGYFEKEDLHRVLDLVDKPPVVVLGTSLGAAVALQASGDSRISAVVAIATFSDLRTVATERAPFFASNGNIRDALRIAEQSAGFHVDEVSPLRAAASAKIPVLLIHGLADDETPPSHSERVFGVMHAPKKLILVPRAGHSDALFKASWPAIDGWLGSVLLRDGGLTQR